MSITTSYIITPIQRLSKKLSNGSFLLFFAAIIAVVLANSPLRSGYEALLNTPISLKIGNLDILNPTAHQLNLHTFINDVLMTIFFFIIGLEIKRELLVGELSSIKKSLLPIIAAVGGMILPIVIFHILNPNAPQSIGSAIPMATDIAFALGVLAMVGSKVPICIKVFLTALAVVDDIGGIIVIAIFYSNDIVWSPLLIATLLFAIIYIAGKSGVRSRIFYYFMLFLVWRQFMESGIHATIAGVITAMLIPARPKVDLHNFMNKVNNSLNRLPHNEELKARGNTVLSENQINILKNIESIADRSISPLQAIIDDIHNIVSYIILPLFAFANAGLILSGSSDTIFTSVSIGIVLALFVGKTLGIFGFTYLSIKTKIVSMPSNTNFKQLFGVSILGGIGFTVSLFIANLSYGSCAEGMDLLNQAKIGIFSGSIISGVIGYLILSKTIKKKLD